MLSDVVKKVYKKLTKRTKTVLMVWIIICVFSVEQIKIVGVYEYFSVCLFGIIFFGGITQMMTRKKTTNLRQKPEYNFGTGPKKPLESPKHYDKMEGLEFEHYCANLLKKNGFSDVEVTKGSGDQGIDIVAYKDGIKYGVQCKCYASDIGNKAVQEAFAGRTYYNCHVAAVLTNRHFTKSAKELAEKNGILLWDREKLESFISANS